MRALPAAAALAAVLVLAPAVRGQTARYPKAVGIDAVRAFADVVPRPDVVLVDVRTEGYDAGHIPGAIAVAATQPETLAAALPYDRQKPLIFYCENADCAGSHEFAYRAERLGYRDVSVYAEGLSGWGAGGGTMAVSAAFIERLARDRLRHTLIDARPRRTAVRGMIPGAINIPEAEFEQQADKLPADRSSLLIYYCGGVDCPLSGRSAAKARALGYRDVRIYAEGHPEWQRLYGAGPAAGAAAPKAVVLEPGKENGSVTVASFEKVLKEQPDAINLVDVRDPKEFAAGTFKGAKNVPMNSLEKAIDQLPKDKPTVFICGTGARSGEAYDTVKLVKPDLPVYFIDATIKFLGDGKFEIEQK